MRWNLTLAISEVRPPHRTHPPTENFNMDEFDNVEYDAGAAGGETLAVGEHVYDEAQLQKQTEALRSQQSQDTYIPEAVTEFIGYFRKCLLTGSEYQVLGCYESSWRKLSERFYKGDKLWPSPDAVVGIVDDDPIFMLFYKEVYYRHVYSRSGARAITQEQRADSYRNYCELFSMVLNENVEVELPAVWIWDIVDEFVYQFTCYARGEGHGEKENEQEGHGQAKHGHGTSEIWGMFSVLNILYSLAGRAAPLSQSAAVAKGSLAQTMGYFANIGLLKMHTQLGDFTTALKCLGEAPLDKRAFFTRVASAHFNVYYYVSVCYMMLGRYADATKTVSHILQYIARTRNLERSPYDSLAKRTAQGYAVLALSVGCAPTRLDDPLHSILRERFGDQLAALRRGGASARKAAKELFVYCAPKFVSVSEDDCTSPADVLEVHARIFLLSACHALDEMALRPYLSLYASTEVSKLALFTAGEADAEPESDGAAEKAKSTEAKPDVVSMRASLMGYKARTRQPRWALSVSNDGDNNNNNTAPSTGSKGGNLLQGDVVNVSDLDIVLDADRVHVAETKSGRRFADWFIRSTIKNYGVQEYVANPDKEQPKRRNNK